MIHWLLQTAAEYPELAKGAAPAGLLSASELQRMEQLNRVNDRHLETIRHHRLNLAGKLVHTARRCFLMLSDRYRYQAVWRFAIGRLAHLQFG